MKNAANGRAGPGVQELVGVDPSDFPLLAERLAIEATDTLRAAANGLGALRDRVFVRRLWHAVTGGTHDLQIAVSGDLLAMQRAALGLIGEVMREEGRTQSCVERVLVNLHAVNRELDAVTVRVDELDGELERGRRALVVMMTRETERLAGRIEAVRREVHREAWVRRLSELYRGGALHRGASAVVGAAMYLATVREHFRGARSERRAAERRAALAVVSQRLPASPQPLEDALLEAVEEATAEARRALLFFGPARGPGVAVLRALTWRRMAGLANREVNALEAIAVVRAQGGVATVGKSGAGDALAAGRDGATAETMGGAPATGGLLASRLVRPAELAEILADELGDELGDPLDAEESVFGAARAGAGVGDHRS